MGKQWSCLSNLHGCLLLSLTLKIWGAAPRLSPLVVFPIFLCSLLGDLTHCHGFKYLYLCGSEFIFSAFYFSLGSRCVCLTLFSTSPLGCLQSNFKFNSFKIEFLIFFSPTVSTLIFINGTAIHSARAKLLQLCVTHCDPMDCSPPGSSVHGILQARILVWVCHALLQGIFPTQGRNPHLLFLLHCSDQTLEVILDVCLAHRPHIYQKISLYQKIIVFTITFLGQDHHSDSRLVSLLLILPTAKPGNLIKNVNQVMEVTFVLKILQGIYSVKVEFQLLTRVCKPLFCPHKLISCCCQLYSWFLVFLKNMELAAHLRALNICFIPSAWRALFPRSL